MRTYIKSARHGKFILMHGDMISEFVNLYGEWCEGEIELFNQIIPKNGVVIEIGSNIGMHSIPISRICNEGKLFCFEPQRIIFQILCGNIALNNITNIHAFQEAVGDTEEFIDIQSSEYEKSWNYGSFSIEKGFNTEGKYPDTIKLEQIKVISFNNFFNSMKLERVDLIKVDAEGYESKILSASNNIIKEFKPFIFIENNSKENFEKVIEGIRNLNYLPFWYCSARYRENNFNNAFWKIDGFDINMLCYHEDKKISHQYVPVDSFDDLNSKRIPIY